MFSGGCHSGSTRWAYIMGVTKEWIGVRLREMSVDMKIWACLGVRNRSWLLKVYMLGAELARRYS